MEAEGASGDGGGVMRIFLAYDGGRVTVDVESHQTIGDVKELVRTIYGIGPDDGVSGTEQLEKKLLSLIYAGAHLQNQWLLSDIGIQPGSTVKAILQDEIKPFLFIYSAFNGETKAILEKIQFLTTPISDIRAIVSRRIGLPVSVFRLVTKDGMEMYDCHVIDKYAVELGNTVNLETWDGWSNFLNLCMMGFASHVLAHLSHDDVVARFQMKVALYIAAHCGHVDLAVSLLRMGIKADEPIGDHPTRQWCKSVNDHIDSYKTPAHEAAEAGQLGVLRSFVHHNVCNVLAKDGNGLTPLNIALRKKQRPCASFLLTKQWSKINYSKKSSIPLSIYVKMKRWSEKAKGKVLVIQGQWKSSIKNPKRHMPAGALVGHGVLLDGFSESQLNSRSSAELHTRQEEEQRRKKPVFDFTEEDKKLYSGEMQPDAYFKALDRMDSVKLPRLNRWGRNMTKAAQEHESRLGRYHDDALSVDTRDAAGGDSSEIESKFGASQNPDLQFPPIHKTKRGRNVSISQPNMICNVRDGVEVEASEQSTRKPTAGPLHGGESVVSSPTKRAAAVSQSSPSEFTKKDNHDRTALKDAAHAGNNGDKTPRKKTATDSALLMAKARTADGAIPLPMVSTVKNPRPFDGHKGQDVMQKTLTLYEKHRGIKSRDYAIKCLMIANNFKEKPWLSQVHQAMIIARSGVRKIVAQQPNMFQSSASEPAETPPRTSSEVAASEESPMSVM